ncbi:MAG: CPBP family intramembrane glutamic endopeptidase [Planctomycetota bacterium]
MKPGREVPRFSFSAYLEESRRPIVSLVFVLPILIAYEAGVRLMNLGRTEIVVNAADALIKKALEALGIYGTLLSALSIVVILLFLQVRLRKPWRVRRATLLGMGLESALMALPLFALDRGVQAVLFLAASGGKKTVIETLVLSLGAGVYEEFLFRLLLLGGLLWTAYHLLRKKNPRAQAVCVLISALLFALVHHLGPQADPFGLRLFAFRTVAGVYFSWIYLSRGFGIAVGCHSVYDVLVVALRELA